MTKHNHVEMHATVLYLCGDGGGADVERVAVLLGDPVLVSAHELLDALKKLVPIEVLYNFCVRVTNENAGKCVSEVNA